MRGILENGEVVRNKRDGIEKAVFYLENSGQDWVYIMRYDNPEYVWFTVGYVDRPNIKNYVKLRPDMTSEKLKKLYAWRERVMAKRDSE